MAVVKVPGMSVITIIPVAYLRSELLWIAELRSRRVLKALVMMVLLVLALVLNLVLRLKMFSSPVAKIAWVEIQPSWILLILLFSLIWALGHFC
jgi:hypothetical protein